MFAAYKENAAKRKAARAANNARFKARMAEINAQSVEFDAALATARESNKAALKAELAANTAKLKRTWRDA